MASLKNSPILNPSSSVDHKIGRAGERGNQFNRLTGAARVEANRRSRHAAGRALAAYLVAEGAEDDREARAAAAHEVGRA